MGEKLTGKADLNIGGLGVSINLGKNTSFQITAGQVEESLAILRERRKTLLTELNEVNKKIKALE